MNGTEYTAYTYKESRDVLIKNGAAVARYCIRTPILGVSDEINGIYEKAGEAFRRFVTSKAFSWAEELYDERLASDTGKGIFVFPTVQYLFYITVTHEAWGYLSISSELTVLSGNELRYADRRCAVWDVKRLCPVTLGELMRSLGLEKKLPKAAKRYRGFYLNSGKLILYSTRPTFGSGERLRDLPKHFTEYRLDIPRKA